MGFPGAHAPGLLGELGGAVCNSSDIPGAQGDRDRALELADAAVAETKKPLDIEANNAQYKRYLRFSYARVFMHLHAFGRYEFAAERAEQPVVDLGEAYDWYWAATCFATCLWWIARDEDLDDQGHQRTHDEYAARALEMLREARSRGYAEPLTEEVFDPLRHLPEFKELEKS